MWGKVCGSGEKKCASVREKRESQMEEREEIRAHSDQPVSLSLAVYRSPSIAYSHSFALTLHLTLSLGHLLLAHSSPVWFPQWLDRVILGA